MKSIVVGTAGHIDHGKSALVRALTGTDPDRLKEEQARGITIDLGFAHAAIEGIDVAFVDVPGHERFVKNMLAGVGGIDAVVLVVAADESVMPQTREHFDICRLLHVPIGLVALTKSDLVDADTLELARLEVRELVAGSFLDGAPIVPVSSKTAAGLDDLRRALVDASLKVRDRGAGSVARLPIDRVFSMKGFGTVVTGTLVAGRLAVDDELVIQPRDVVGGISRTVKVRGLQVHGQKQTSVSAGHRTAVNLSGVDVADVWRGQDLATPAAFETTRVADAVVDVLATAKPIKHGQRVRFHQGTAELLGRVSIVGASEGRVDAGARGYVRLRLESHAVLARGDRYILRAYSPPITIAGGVILDPQPPRTAIRTPAALDRLRRLERDPISAMIADAGAAALAVSALVTRAAVDPRDVDTTIDTLVAAGAAERAGDRLVAPAVLARVREAIVAALSDLHRTSPLSEGMPRDELRERALAGLPRRGVGGAKGGGHVAVLDRALHDLEREGRVVVRDRVALATHKVSLSPEEDRARDTIERAYRSGGLKPPEPSAIAAEAGVAPAVADRVVKLLQRQKLLVRVDTLLFHDEALKALKAEVAAMKATVGQAARIDVATFKERFGVTRKFAIPLLEYLDRERITRRVGDARVIL